MSQWQPGSAPKPFMADENASLRSYGRVAGRKLRAAQVELLDRLMPAIGLDLDPLGANTQYKQLFGSSTKRENILEIGFGGGEFMAHYAHTFPECSYVGCEPYVNGVAGALYHIDQRKLDNVRVLHGDARLLLEKLADGELDQVFILFADPWPKARHHKKRLVQTAFLEQLAQKVRKGGKLLLATDHADYAVWMAEHIQAATSWVERKNLRAVAPDYWQETRYQQKAKQEGRTATFYHLVKQ